LYVLWFFIVWAYAPPAAMNTQALLPSADSLVTVLGALATACVVCSLLFMAGDKTAPVNTPASNSNPSLAATPLPTTSV
jgi:hypothetical protein